MVSPGSRRHHVGHIGVAKSSILWTLMRGAHAGSQGSEVTLVFVAVYIIFAWSLFLHPWRGLSSVRKSSRTARGSTVNIRRHLRKDYDLHLPGAVFPCSSATILPLYLTGQNGQGLYAFLLPLPALPLLVPSGGLPVAFRLSHYQSISFQARKP